MSRTVLLAPKNWFTAFRRARPLALSTVILVAIVGITGSAA